MSVPNPSAENGLDRLLSPWASSLRLKYALLALIVVLCAFGNLPWTLDEYDQAKQAYVSYEISTGGDWLYQHVPRGGSATKPPLAAWIALGVQRATGSWDLAWRLPGFLSTLVLLGLLIREGNRILPAGGAVLAAAAFGVNFLTPRISTLVRTDMMLTLWIFLAGWLIYRKVRDNVRWTSNERWLFFAAMLAALMTKGPIIYAFLSPGMVAFALLAPKERRRLVWSGWWTWLGPLAIFVAWGVYGILTHREFYEDVVVREFFSRFDQSLKAHERQQPLWFYLPHLIHKFLPWSLLLIAIPIASANARRAIRERPEVLWLACWAAGGLLCMTFIPSKRVDRIFPVIPPFCLLLVALVAACQCGRRIRTWTGAAIAFAVVFWGAYFAGIIWLGYQDKIDHLVVLGKTVRSLAAPASPAIVNANDEGLVLYADGGRSLSPESAAQLWDQAKINALLVPESALPAFGPLPPPALVAPGKRESRYFLFLRPPRP
jgi:4-amino-4-deoxy-L-arabinose transferase-like glycosyltransferase